MKKIFIFLFISSQSQSLSLETQLQLMDLKKPTVCSMTINSEDEKQVFQKYLGRDFNFIELASKKSNWFEEACHAGVQCDILLISGHFGLSFFGKNGYKLPLSKLEIRTCQTGCDGILKRPKEVFLFGCNTLASKRKDHRTPEEYIQVLVDDGFSRLQAEEISAFRYSPIGMETKDRMRRVFPNSKIYGFYSQSPLGPYMRPLLNQYFKSFVNYKDYIEKFNIDKKNKSWSQSMRGLWAQSINGSLQLERPACILGDDQPVHEKLSWINNVLSDKQKSLSYIPMIHEYLKDLEREKGSLNHLSKRELSLIKKIQYNEKALDNIELILENPINHMQSIQIQILQFAEKVKWYNKEEYNYRLKNLTSGMFKENLSVRTRDMICSLGIELDLTMEDLPFERWNADTIYLIGCLGSKDPRIYERLMNQAKEDSQWMVRQFALESLFKIKSHDPKIYEILKNQAMRDSSWRVRSFALKSLSQYENRDLQTYKLLMTLARHDNNDRVRKTALDILFQKNFKNKTVQNILKDRIKRDDSKLVRKTARDILDKF